MNDHGRKRGVTAGSECARPGSTAVGCSRGTRIRWARVEAQLSKSGAASGTSRNRLKPAGLPSSFPAYHSDCPVYKIIRVSRAPVKVTRRGDNQG
jgi:hypothetical protein